MRLFLQKGGLKKIAVKAKESLRRSQNAVFSSFCGQK